MVCAVAYLMYYYWWGLQKSLDYILSKKADVAPQRAYMQQLYLLDKRLR